MDKLGDTFSSFTGSGNNQQQGGSGQAQKKEGGGGFMDSIGDKFNSAAGGGKESEKNEDYLDKGPSSSFDDRNCPLAGVLRRFKLI